MNKRKNEVNQNISVKRRVKFIDQSFEITNLNNIIHKHKDNTLEFIDSNNFLLVDKFFGYFINEVCRSINNFAIVYKYMQILDQLKNILTLHQIYHVDIILIYILQRFIFFIKKFNLMNELKQEIKDTKDFNPDILINKIKEKIVIDNLLTMKTSTNISDSNSNYIDLIDELKIYKTMIKTQDWDVSLNYLRGFYSVYLTMLIDLIQNYNKIKSIETLVLEYELKFLDEYKINNFNDLSKLFGSLNLHNYIENIKLLL
jgi:hypothetical protein